MVMSDHDAKAKPRQHSKECAKNKSAAQHYRNSNNTTQRSCGSRARREPAVSARANSIHCM